MSRLAKVLLIVMSNELPSLYIYINTFWPQLKSPTFVQSLSKFTHLTGTASVEAFGSHHSFIIFSLLQVHVVFDNPQLSSNGLLKALELRVSTKWGICALLHWARMGYCGDDDQGLKPFIFR